MTGTVRSLRPSQVLKAHRAAVLDAIEQHGASNPRIFGSVARGTDTLDSDIDIIVSVTPENAWKFISLAPRLTELLGVRVDVLSEGGLLPKHARLLSEARAL